MAKLLLLLLLLPAAALPGAGEIPLPLIPAIDLNAELMLTRPDLAAADTLALLLEASREAYYKISERGEVLAAGQLRPGSNSLLLARPRMFAGSQSLFFLLDLLENGEVSQKKITIAVQVAGGPEMERREKAALSGSFTLAMFHAGRPIGFRQKSMAALLNLKTGPVMPVADPALGSYAGRNQSAGQSVSILGLGMALAKFLAGKKAEKRAQSVAAESRKKRLAMSISRDKREIPIVIELKTE